MGKLFTCFTLVILLVSVSCTATNLGTDPTAVRATPEAVSQLLVSANPDSTFTPTPFQPVGATVTATPTSTPIPTPAPTVEPTKTEVVEIPTPVHVDPKLPAGVTSFLILGSDFRPPAGFRTDVIQLVIINGDKGTLSIVSFPRDLYVTIPGWMDQRINTAFPHGGFGLMADTLQYNFGIRPKYYVLTNFDGFKGIVNSLGGVKVDVGAFLSDKCDLPQQVNSRCTVYPGKITMDGSTALWYVRSRHTTNDIDRGRRVQEVLYGLFNKLMSKDAVTRLPELYQSYRSSVETNMSVEDILPLLPLASQVMNDSSRIHRYTIGAGQVYDYVTSGGAMVLLPNFAAINQTLTRAINGE